MKLCELFFGQEGNGLESSTTEGTEGNLVVRAYSSDLPTSERKTVLDMFKSQKVHMCVSLPLYSHSTCPLHADIVNL